MSIKMHVLYSHLEVFKSNMGSYSEEQGERFHQDLQNFERRYQRPPKLYERTEEDDRNEKLAIQNANDLPKASRYKVTNKAAVDNFYAQIMNQLTEDQVRRANLRK